MNITYHKNNTHIEDSYKIQDREAIEKEVDYIMEVREAMRYPVRKSSESYVREWVGHNRLYNIDKKGRWRSHTKDVDLDEPSSLLNELIWLILGI